jgi:benzoylformate decarboxylase
MPGKTGRFAMIEQFLVDDIHYMFGNPGTVEQGFLDALEEYPSFKYIMGLQETVAVGIADGYARATKKPTVVQLHSGVGLGNGIGMMYQAMRGHAPLIVLAGEAGIKYDAMDSQMAADLVSMARPVTKWATRVVDSRSLVRVLRRAIKIASTPPMGPVFVCVPADILDAENDEPIVPTSMLDTRVAPTREQIAHAVDLLAGAQHPMIIVGDGIAFSRAQGELAAVAEALGAEVWGADASEANLPFNHPLWKGMLGHMFGGSSTKVTTKADGVLIVGTYVFPEVFPNFEDVFNADAKIVHVDLNAYEIAKNFPVDVGMVSDPKTTLAALAGALASRMTGAQKQAAAARLEASRSANAAALQKQLEHDRSVRDQSPLHASRFMEELAKHVPADVMIFDEALTTSPDLTRYLPPVLPDHFFQTRGGSLGVGIPGALGVKIAHPEKTVIGFTGDGGSMYTIQALWTAAHYNIGAKFVICNNQSYMLLKLNIMQYWKDQIGEPLHEFPHSFDLGDPVINFAELAQSMGVPGVRVDRPQDVEAAVKQMLATDGPFLVDMVITNQVPGV